MSPAESQIWAEYTPRINAARAAEKEALEAAFVIDAPEFVDGIPVKKVTLRHWMLLTVMDNAYVRGGEITEADALDAMWILSLGYEAKNKKKRDEVQEAIAKNHDMAAVIIGLEEMFERAFMAAPLSSNDPNEKRREEPLKVGFAAILIHRIASAYHWSRETIIDTPLCEAFQYLRMIDVEEWAKNGKDYPQLGGKSDKLMAEALGKINDLNKTPAHGI